MEGLLETATLFYLSKFVSAFKKALLSQK